MITKDRDTCKEYHIEYWLCILNSKNLQCIAVIQYIHQSSNKTNKKKNFADRNGDWEGHLHSVQELKPVSRESDSINYLCYGSRYLEKNAALTKRTRRHLSSIP